MIGYTSNLSDVVKSIEIKIDSLSNADKILRQAAFDTVALVTDRVQQDGLKANNSPIQSFYSAKYGQRRRRKGLQTQYVDLTFSGDMLDDFLPAPLGNEFVVGFKSEKQGHIAAFNEQRFGVVFNLSSSESDVIIKGILNKINDTLK